MTSPSSRGSAKRSDSRTVIDEGTDLQGTFMFSGEVTLNGRLRGEIVSTDTLVVGEKAVINASISGCTVEIHGEVFGPVSATARLQLVHTARVHGDIDAPVVVIEEGAILEGHCRTGARTGEQPASAGDYPPVSAEG